MRDSRDRDPRDGTREGSQWDRDRDRAPAEDKSSRDGMRRDPRDRDRDPREAKDSRVEYPSPPSPTPLIATGINLTNMKAFLTSPAPKGHGTIQCYIRRNKSGNLPTSYSP